MIDQKSFTFSRAELEEARADIKAAIDAAKENDRFTGTTSDVQVKSAVDFLLYLRHSARDSEPPLLDVLPPLVSVGGEFVFELWYGERSLVIYIDDEGIIDTYPFEGDTYQWPGLNPPTHNQHLHWLRNGKE